MGTALSLPLNVIHIDLLIVFYFHFYVIAHKDSYARKVCS